jgi:hypothetical protein
MLLEKEVRCLAISVEREIFEFINSEPQDSDDEVL